MSSIEVQELTKSFGDFIAVNHLSFEIEEGEIFGILGPNGAGKTTTIRILAGLLSPSAGMVRVGGLDLGQNSNSLKVRQLVGILTENPSLYERLTAYENMEFFASAYGLSNGQEKAGRIRELLEVFDLWERRLSKVATFSKGMKQKLAIARALVHNPPIVFLDEPTSGLDPRAAKGIRDLMERLSHQANHTILLSTHRLEDAERLCNRVLIINRGKKIITGTPEKLQATIAGEPVLQVTLKQVNMPILNAVRALKSVKDVQVDKSNTRLQINLVNIEDATPEVVRCLVNADGRVYTVQVLRPSLEEVYLKLIQEECK